MAETALSATLDITEPVLHALESGDPDVVDAVNGNSFTNTGAEVLVVDNTGGSSRTIQFRNADTDVAIGSAITIPGNDMAVFGPFSKRVYGATVAFLGSHTDLNVRVFNITRTRNILTTRKHK